MLDVYYATAKVHVPYFVSFQPDHDKADTPVCSSLGEHFRRCAIVTERSRSILFAGEGVAQSVQCLTADWTAGVRSPTEAVNLSF
jgi:hypothetical protein